MRLHADEKYKIRNGIKNLVENDSRTTLELHFEGDVDLSFTTSENGENGKFSEIDEDDAYKMKYRIEREFDVVCSVLTYGENVNLDIHL